MAETTVLEMAKAIRQEDAALYANVFATSYPVQGLLPIMSMTGFAKPITIADTLPTVTPRDFGADFIAAFGKHSTYMVEWKNYGGRLEIDKALIKGNPQGAADQEVMQVQAIAKQWAADVLEGQGGTSVVGIQKYLANFFSGQILNSTSSTANGDALTMDLMDKLLDQVAGADALFMSKYNRRLLTTLARTNAAGQQNISWVEDRFGVQVEAYNKVPIYTMEDAETGADILSNIQRDGADANNSTTSVYAVHFGEDGVFGFAPGGQALDVEVVNPGTHAMVTRLESNVGIGMSRRRGAGQIKFLKSA